MVELILFYKFFDDGHEFCLIGFGLLQIFLHELDFHIDGSDGLLFLIELKRFLFGYLVIIVMIARKSILIMISF